MPPFTLTRRRSQVELLTEACAQRRPARLAFSAPGGTTTARSRLLSVDRYCVWVEWPDECASPGAAPGAPVDVFFELHGERFAFRAPAYGAFYRYFDVHGVRSALRIGLPPRIERRQQRAHFRVPLAAVAPIEARLTAMDGASASVSCRLLNISCGGLAGLAPWAEVEPLCVGGSFWSEFTLPGDPQRIEFAVRLAHRRRTLQGDRGVLGCAFSGGDDQSPNRGKLEHIRRFVTQQQREMLKRAALR